MTFKIAGAYSTILSWDGTTYPTRPSGLADGSVMWIGPNDPTSAGATANDVWLDSNSMGGAGAPVDGGVPLLSGPAAMVGPLTLLGTAAVGDERVNPADPISFSKIKNVPMDLPAGAGPSLHTLGAGGGQAAPGPSALVRRRAGSWQTPLCVPSGTNQSVAATAGVGYYWPLTIERPMTIGNFGVGVATAAAAGQANFAVYADYSPSYMTGGVAAGQGYMAGAPVFTSSTINLTATGNIQSTGSITLAPGFYWVRVGLSVTSGTAVLMSGLPIQGVLPTANPSPNTPLQYDLGALSPPTWATTGANGTGGGVSIGGIVLPFYQVQDIL